MGSSVDGTALVVVAPAGYGKSTFLAQWAARCRDEGRAVAWVGCSAADSDPTVLFADLRDAMALGLRKHDPLVCLRLLDLANPTLESLESGVDEVALVLDELSTSLVVVIDDLHVAGGEPIQQLLAAVAAALPSSATLALGSRAEPQPLLTTLRLARQVDEVDAADLALTRSQIADLAREAGLDPGPVADELLRQTEGWPAAVRLGVMAARSGQLGTAARLPLGYDRSVSEYLRREVLTVLSPRALQLLRSTAVLDSMSAGLASAMTGFADAGSVLDELFAAQALVRRVSADEPWYVVHSLLRSHLLAETAAHDVAEHARQHRIAARWFAEHHLPKQALIHALDANDPGLLHMLVRDEGATLVVAGLSATVLDALAKIGAERYDDDLVGLAALAQAESGDLASAQRTLAAHAAPSPPGPVTRHEPALLRVAQFCVRRLEGRPDDPLLPAEFADVLGWRATGPWAGAGVDRALLLLLNRGQWEYATGRYEASWDDLRLALETATTHRRDRIALACMSTLAGLPALRGEASATAAHVENVLGLIDSRGWSTHPSMANVYSAGAWAASLMLRPDDAEQMMQRAKQVLRGNVDPEYATYAAAVDTMLQADRQGDADEAMDVLARFAQSGPDAEMTPDGRAFAGMQRVRIMLRRGDLDGAQAASGDLARWFPDRADPWLARAQVAVARGQWWECLAAVEHTRAMRLPVGVPANAIVAPLLECVASHQLGRLQAARTALLAALDVAAPRGVVRPFYDAGPVVRDMLAAQQGRFGVHEDFVATILERWALVDRRGREDALPPSPSVRLTPREQDVLRELPSLMTVDEIAAAHHVSVNTVRTHMRALYRKLAVRTRRDAVRRGRDLGLV